MESGNNKFEGFILTALSHPQDPPLFPGCNESQVRIPLSDRNLVNKKDLRTPGVICRELLLKMALVNRLHRLPAKRKVFGNLFYRHIPAQLKNVGSEPSSNPFVRIHERELFNHRTTPSAAYRSVDHREIAASVNEVQILYISVVVRVNLVQAFFALGAERAIAYIGSQFYVYTVLFTLYRLLHNLYSPKLKKCSNLNIVYRLSPPG